MNQNRHPQSTTTSQLTGEELFSPPNLITLSRLVLASLVFALIYFTEYWILSTVVFLIAAATDALDGYIARKYGMVTTLGRILDPFADKFIIGGVFIFLLAKESSGVNAWMVVIVIARELFVTTLRAFLEREGIDFSATFSGKLKMILQCVAVPASLLSMSSHFDFEGFRMLRDVLLWLAVAITAWSGLIYLFRAKTLLSQSVES